MNEELTKELGPDAAEVLKLHDKIMDAAEASLKNAIRCGELLTIIKNSLEHGDWLPYLSRYIPTISESTAKRYMACWKNRERLLKEGVERLSEAYKLLKEPKPASGKQKPKSKSVTVTDLVDSTGTRVPDEIAAEYQRAWDEVKVILRAVTDIKSVCKEHAKDVAWSEVDHQRAEQSLVNAFHTIKMAMPHAVCATCNGFPGRLAAQKCSTCNNRGWVSKFFWKTCVPEELRAMRERKGKK